MIGVLDILTQNHALFLIMAGILGLIVGSFINVVIHRMPKTMLSEWRHEISEFIAADEALKDATKNDVQAHYQPNPSPNPSTLRSRCPHCTAVIAWQHNIPVISYLLLSGRCASCQAKISLNYPVTELLTAVLSILIVHHFGVSIQAGLALIFLWYLVALSGIDYHTKLLPDRLLVPLGMVGLIANTQHVFTTPSLAIWGLVMGFVVFWGINALFKVIMGKDGMGLGDAKLLGVLGAWLGMFYLPMIVFIAALLGVIAGIINKYRQDEEVFAFGPYLSIGGLFSLLYGETTWSWYGVLALN